MLISGVEDQDQHVDPEDLREHVLAVGEVHEAEVPPPEAEQRGREERAEVVHRRDDREQPDHVEPAGEPRPAGSPEPVRPPVRAAGGRERGGQLGHADRDREDDRRDHGPADRDRDRPAEVPRLPVDREAAGEHRDDRERDREVGELRPAAVQLLLVAQLGELLGVPIEAIVRHVVLLIRVPAPSRKGLTPRPSGATVSPCADGRKRPGNRAHGPHRASAPITSCHHALAVSSVSRTRRRRAYA